MNETNFEKVTLGGGCFWCIEAIFQEIIGVEAIVSGYSGGKVPGRPTYREICSGLTGYAEVIEITFDTTKISYKDIIFIFMTSHDPTTLNQQGADIGTQYRSVIFYHSEAQKIIASQIIEEVKPYYNYPVVTELSEMTVFYEAEKEHQDYYKNNQGNNYCSIVINPKLSKLRKLHSNKLKTVSS